MIILGPSLHSPSVATGSIPRGTSAPCSDVPAAAEPPCATFREVFDSHARFVWRSLSGLGVHPADVPDASQQVFLIVHARLQAERIPAAAMRTFAYGVCLRIASDFRRRAHRRRESLSAEPPELPCAPIQERNVALGEALALLEVTLDRLPAPQREAFVLYEIEELGMSDVARALGCPLQTAYSRLHAARKVVMAALGGSLDEQPLDVAGRFK